MSTIGENIKRYRKEMHITQQELAAKVNMSRSHIASIEVDKYTPSLSTVELIAEALHVSPGNIMEWKGETDRRHEIRRSSDAIRIPVLGHVAAGIPLDAIQDSADDWEEIPASMAAGGESFIALTIHGTSMEPRMREGDVVIIRLQDDVENGDIALVYVNGNDATCKKVTKTEKGILLRGFNTAFEPLFYSWDEVADIPVRIAGKVVELRAKF